MHKLEFDPDTLLAMCSKMRELYIKYNGILGASEFQVEGFYIFQLLKLDEEYRKWEFKLDSLAEAQNYNDEFNELVELRSNRIKEVEQLVKQIINSYREIKHEKSIF